MPPWLPIWRETTMGECRRESPPPGWYSSHSSGVWHAPKCGFTRAGTYSFPANPHSDPLGPAGHNSVRATDANRG